MRRIWFTILLVVSLACSATASAWAAQNCPDKAMPVASHDCCPQPPAAPGDKPDKSKTIDCKLGQACRAAPALTPQLPVIATALVRVVDQPALADHDGVRSTVLTGLWRPPRSL
jgi:hypothetical protein